MLSIIRTTFSPLVSLFVLLLGNGLFTTLLTVRLHLEGVDAMTIGSMTAAFYAGLVFASFRIERIIIRVGHIRAYSAFACVLAVVTLLPGMIIEPTLWIILRFMSGVATAGLFIVIESWLLVLGTAKTRGQVLAIYMVALYAGQGLGQFLLNLADPATLDLFAVTSILTSLSVIPLAMTKTVSPKIEETQSLSLKKLYQKSATGFIGCFCSGLILSAIYGLLPLFITEKTSAADVPLFMFLTIIGGMALQYPVGRVSDFIERRVVLIVIAILTILASLFMIFSFEWFLTSIIITFIFGGLTFTLYPISISHACDSLEMKDMISGSQGLLLAYSLGATIGPLIAPVFMKLFGPNGLFVYFAIVCTTFVAFVSWRRAVVAPHVQEENFMVLPQTTPITAELDPRTTQPKS